MSDLELNGEYQFHHEEETAPKRRFSYKFVSKEELFSAANESSLGGVLLIAERLLAEREAYRMAAGRFRQDSLVRQESGDLVVPIWIYCENDVDDEARRLLEEKK